MIKNNRALYDAFMAGDARFDGKFFVGISSTGIYCRPVCRTRQPKFENCTFYETAAEAEQAGYRPCLLCRPEQAPGRAIVDATADLAHRAARMLEEKCGSGQTIDNIADRLGCTDRHLRRVFTAEYNVSPVQYLQTCRLLLAKNLLTDTNLSVLDVAMSSGFGSLRRFNDAFKEHYDLAPTALRKRMSKEKKHSSNINLALSYRPPYPWDDVLGFLSVRAIKGIEVADKDKYMRTVYLKNSEGKSIFGWVQVSDNPKKNVLDVTVSETLLPELPQVLAKIKHLFDLYCDPGAVYKTLHVMNDIRPGLCTLGTRVPGCFDSFEMAVRAVLGQQITVKAAGTLAERIVGNFGIAVRTGIPGLTYSFPLLEDIVAMGDEIQNSFGKLGVTSARSNTILDLANAVTENDIKLDSSEQPEDEIRKLMEIKGIGGWTAQYIAMRTMEWPDAFLDTDVGVKKALGSLTSKELLQVAEAWRPWRSYATMNLWNNSH